MTDKLCGTCVWKSDGFQSEPDYCYILDHYVDPGSTCDEWRESLRAEPLNHAPIKDGETVVWFDTPRLDCDYRVCATAGKKPENDKEDNSA